MQKLGQELQLSESEEIIQSHDRDGDGSLSVDEFKQVLFNKQMSKTYEPKRRARSDINTN